MMKKIGILSLIPLGLGLSAMMGWWIHSPALVTLTTLTPMLFNCALCFCLAGFALLLADNPAPFARQIQIACGIIISLLAMTTLTEDMFNLDLRIDELCVKCWLPAISAHHGRMPAVAAVNFLMVGLALIFLRYSAKETLALGTEIFIFLVFLISVFGLIGYAIKLQFLYSWYSYTYMSFSSSICFLAICIVLWDLWRHDPESIKLYQNRQDLKIVLLTSAVLVCVSLTVGFVSIVTDIQLILPVACIAILLGIMVIRWQVRPLIRRTLSAEKDLRQSNKRLFESEERYSLAFKGNLAGVWDWKVGSKIIFSSPYLKALLGYAEHEMPDTVAFYHQIAHPDDLDRILKLIELHLSKNVPYKIEFRLKTKNTGYRWFESIGQAIYDEEGNPARMIGSMRDITENKKSEKLKNEFVSLVRNELNAPVRSIKESLDTIINHSDNQLSPIVMKFLKRAHQNCERLSFLMSEILDVAKIESGGTTFKFKLEDIMTIVQKAIISRQTYAERNGVHLRLAQAADHVKVNVDAELLLQVLTNLIANAVKFSPDGGEVTIAVARRGDFVRVAVTDQGPGIPEQFQPQIFQQYVHVESAPVREGEGVLLGLKLSKAIVEEFGGAMSFLTTPKHGTTFYFDLPQARENTLAPPNQQLKSH